MAETKTFTVPNIGCNGCVNTIRSELGELPGVLQVDGSAADKSITVSWQAPADWETILAKLHELDYAPA